jgi:hypothetical protein
VQDALTAWERDGKPQVERLRLRLVPRGATPSAPNVSHAKVYPRRDHTLVAWLDLT